eukprot:847393-Amphidinium_carterae.1
MATVYRAMLLAQLPCSCLIRWYQASCIDQVIRQSPTCRKSDTHSTTNTEHWHTESCTLELRLMQ